jgi:hypothetical protein
MKNSIINNVIIKEMNEVLEKTTIQFKIFLIKYIYTKKRFFNNDARNKFVRIRCKTG